jgi:PPP family 3-phenylpropionic acid transporter
MARFPAWSSATMLAVCISTWWLPDLKEAVLPNEEKVSVLPILKQRTVQWFFAATFFHVLSHMGLYIFFSLYLDALGYSKTTIGALWAVSVVVEIGWFYTQSRWLPKLSLSAWVLVCAAVCALRMVITAGFAHVLWVLVIAQALHAITFAASHSVSIALISHDFPGRLRGRRLFNRKIRHCQRILVMCCYIYSSNGLCLPIIETAPSSSLAAEQSA